MFVVSSMCTVKEVDKKIPNYPVMKWVSTKVIRYLYKFIKSLSLKDGTHIEGAYQCTPSILGNQHCKTILQRVGLSKYIYFHIISNQCLNFKPHMHTIRYVVLCAII